MSQFSVHEAKTQLSRLIEQALAGDEVIITRGSKPVVRLVALQPPATDRKPGRYKGSHVDDTFFEPLPADELAAWNGEK
ncbi:MAG: type II toxin-antitoxin system prevent-host-death family antitoxin [Deltaproteobacteria bacterium]|nr:type II toxin-antitoxin system prevent-host-death family antitoxin [Deltaproteobacteria bacterium]